MDMTVLSESHIIETLRASYKKIWPGCEWLTNSPHSNSTGVTVVAMIGLSIGTFRHWRQGYVVEFLRRDCS